jgi:voltage-gated potassium channel
MIQIVFWISTLIYVAATILEAIFEKSIVTLETLQASLCVYLLIGLIWAFVFTLIDLGLPGSFQVPRGQFIDWTYNKSRAAEFMRLFVFSYATLSGSSYAEIAPGTGFARSSFTTTLDLNCGFQLK